jgi:hypothetical protein
MLTKNVIVLLAGDIKKGDNVKNWPRGTSMLKDITH